jgi:hypothetical protein
VLVGVAETALTPPDGDPIVKLLDVTDAVADAGKAATADTEPKTPRVSAKVPATSFARLHRGTGGVSEGCCLCI